MAAVSLVLSGCSALWTDPPDAAQPADGATTRPSVQPVASEPDTPRKPRRQPALDRVEVSLEPFVTLDAPTAMAVRSGDDALYFAERGGTVRAVRDGAAVQRPVLDITDEVSTGGEQGLLGLTFSANGDVLYVSYTNSDGDSRLDAYPMRGDRVVREERRELLAVDQPYPNHNGGNVVLGPDGMLYLGLGDGGAGGDPEGNAQNPATLLGKMVRLDPRTGRAPDDNPFLGKDEYLPEIYATGLRNPWRFSFDRATGDLWVGDVGQDSIEEISTTPAGSTAGRNFGWDLFEGSQPYESDEPPPGAVSPVVEYPNGDEGCSVTGGFVYRGRAIPDLQGAYLYSDYCAGWIRAVRVAGGKVRDRADLGISASEVASFGEDADGELYVLSLGGKVWRLVRD